MFTSRTITMMTREICWNQTFILHTEKRSWFLLI